jgi:hypothetical protein
MHSRATHAPRRPQRSARRRLALAAAAFACLAWLILPAAWASAQNAARPSAKAAPSTSARATPPAPALTIASTSPALVQTGPNTWITTILVADSGAAARDVAYKLVPLVPSHRVVTGTVVACNPGTARNCPLALDQVTRVRIRFRARFPVPLGQAVLVIDGHPAGSATAAPALVPQEVQLTVERQVGPWYDLTIPLAVAGALALLTIVLILILARRIKPEPHSRSRPDPMAPHPHVALPGLANGDPVPSRTAPAAVHEAAIEINGEINGESARAEFGADPGRGPGYGASPAEPQPARARRPEPEPVPVKFLDRPIYASASWSFKDSWATNITALGGGVGAIAAAAGATSTVFPGVALDRFAILLAFFAAVVVTGPLVLGLCLPRSDDPDLVQATGFSLLVAAFVTLVGVGGEIGTIGSLIWLSSPARDVRLAVLLLPAAAFAIVAWYACRTTVELAAHSQPGGASHYSSAISAGKDSAITL